MEERRFDDLTRVLGTARSRRQVAKGLLGGLVAAVVGRAAVPSMAVAAGGTCSSQKYQTCLSDAKLQYDSLTAHCGTVDGPAWGGSACAMVATVSYSRAIARCQAAQCPSNMSCVNDHCCRGDACCQSDQIHCPGPGQHGEGGTCCPAGSVCCEGGCCTPDKTCCLDYNLTFINPSAAQVCTDLHTDPNNCGACRHKCDGLPCIEGTCQCPTGNTICKGPRNQTCCQPNEYCQSNAFGSVECVPRCSACEVYDPNDSIQPCKPLECDTCQECDPENGQCSPVENGTSCGSGLGCCGGQCVSTQCSSGKQFDLGSCGCVCTPITCPTGQTQDPDTCECVGRCTSITCGVCQQCDPDTGNCVPGPNGTPCSENLVCCNGLCDLNAGTPCCDDPNQVCGDVCCSSGTACGQAANSANTLVCCPVDPTTGATGGVLPDGTCCPPGEFVDGCGGDPVRWVCCAGLHGSCCG